MSIEVSQQFNLTKYTLCINKVNEDIGDFLDGYFLSGFLSNIQKKDTAK